MAGGLAPITFILGSGRSGTTLLRVMLAGHPDLWAPPEMLLAPFETMAEREAYLDARYWEKGGLRRGLIDLEGLTVEEAKAAVKALGDRSIPEVYAHLQSLTGGRTIVDKCPHLAMLGRDLTDRALSWFSDVRVVWIVRHPGSVLRSAANMPMAEVMGQGLETDFEAMWRRANETCAAVCGALPEDHWTRIRYEDLVAEPEDTMRQVCAAIGVPFHPAVLDPYEGDRMREGPKGARAIGDSNMVARKRIQPELATKWLENWDSSSLDDKTLALAEGLGYEIDRERTTPIGALSRSLADLWSQASALEGQIATPSDLDATEGRRFLLRMMSASVDTFVEHGDADHPRFHHAEGPTRKMFADCPDTDYLRAPLRTGPDRVYRLSGRIPPGTVYAGILLYGKGGRVGRRLHDSDLDISADGRFEVRISTDEQAGTWLRADGDETSVIVRQYFTDRKRQAPLEVEIELESPASTPPQLADAQRLTEQVDRASRMLRSVFGRTMKAHKMVSAAGLNRFFPIGGDDLFPTPDNKYQVTWYRFAPGQMLLVRGVLPVARYYSFTLCNAWMESLDYLQHRCVLNHEQIVADKDGRFEVCLANENPGHPNWMDTAGHYAGYAIVRSLLPESEPAPLETQVLYLSEWKTRLASASASNRVWS